MARSNGYEIITQRMIDLLNQDIVPWHRPWIAGDDDPRNFVSQRPYRGINVFMLLCTGYEQNQWITFNQARKLGGGIRKGEHGFPVIFWNRRVKQVETDDGIEDRSYAFLKVYTVFNIEQTKDIEVPPKREFELTWDPIERCEEIVAGMPKRPTIRHAEARAYYRPSTDEVNLPARERFQLAEEYYCTAFHELTHATGHKKRLARAGVMEVNLFGSADYSREELVAEMGATYLCAESGIVNTTIDNSAGYIKGWMRKLRDDPKLVVVAAAQAQKATDFILNRKFDNQED